MHNGHYIAATTSSLISTIFSTLSSIPWEIGYFLQRWTKSLNVALEKKLNVRLLPTLRTVHLLEGDFNTGRKLISLQRAMDNAIQASQIPASEAVMLKRLYYDYL